MEFPSTEDPKRIGTCEFRCHRDATCLPSWNQVCDGRADCADRSDEAKCPPVVAFLQPPSSQHQIQQTPSPHPDFMQEVSGIQICIVAVALVLTLGLITCVINHYNKMGAKPWSADQRKHDHAQKSTSATTTRALYSPSKAQKHAKKELLLYQEHQLRTLSVQRDMALNLPSTVQRPDVEEHQRQPLNSEIPRAYLRPPPNRTVIPGGLVKCPSQNVQQHAAHTLKTAAGYKLVTHPSFHQTAKKNNSSLFVRVSNSLERWHPPRTHKNDVCTIAIFDDTTTDSDDLPPKYEDVVQTPILPPRTSRNPSTRSSAIISFRKVTH